MKTKTEWLMLFMVAFCGFLAAVEVQDQRWMWVALMVWCAFSNGVNLSSRVKRRHVEELDQAFRKGQQAVR